MSTRAGHVQFLNMTWCLGVLLVVIVSNYGVLMYVCIQYIYIILCYCMIVCRRVRALACPDTKGLLFSTSFQCCSGSSGYPFNRILKFQEKVQGISRIMYLYPRPISDRGDSGMLPLGCITIFVGRYPFLPVLGVAI